MIYLICINGYLEVKMSNIENSRLELLEHQEDAYENVEGLFEKGRKNT